MLLADAIMWPVVIGIGLIYLVPLLLVITVIEAMVFSVRMKVRKRAVFKWCLVANIISTMVGGFFFSTVQGFIVMQTGIMDTIPGFVRGFLWVCPLLILAYFAISVLVEWLFLSNEVFLEKIQATRWKSFKAVFIGNVLSYLLVGPLYYLEMRPHFAGLETTYDTKWVQNADQVLYYIDPTDDFIKRINLDGSDQQTLVPFPAISFQMSADESTFAFVGKDLALKVYRKDWAEPKTVKPNTMNRERSSECVITASSLSPGQERLAFRYPLDDGRVYVYDFQKGDTSDLGSVKGVYLSGDSPLQWSADGKRILVQKEKTGTDRDAYMPEAWLSCEWPPGEGEVEWTLQPKPELAELVENYLVLNRDYRASWAPQWTRQRCDEYQFELYPYLGNCLDVMKDERRILRLRNSFGLLDLGFPAFRNAIFLPGCREMLVVWGDDFYVLDFEARKIGLLVPGTRFCLREDSFRGLNTPDSYRR